MKKKILKNFIGMNRDLTPDKVSEGLYYSSENIRLNSTSDLSLGNVQNELGNEKKLEFTDITLNSNVLTLNTKKGVTDIAYSYTLSSDKIVDISPISGETTNVEIVNSITTGNSNILFVNFTKNKEFTCIIEVSFSFVPKLLFISKEKICDKYSDVRYYYEGEDIQKIYFTYKTNQLKIVNIKNQTLYNVLDAYLDIVPKITFGKIEVTPYGIGGTHTSGMIQYAYSQYFLNGQTTGISSLSNMIALRSSDGKGGNLNSQVNQINSINITGIDTNYDILRVYSVKYNTETGIPIINVINEVEITSDEITLYDDNTVVKAVSIEEFQFLGGTIISPKVIEIKDNRLFGADLTETTWDINLNLTQTDSNYFDTRVYRGKIVDESLYYSFDDGAVFIMPEFNSSFNDIIITKVSDDFSTHIESLTVPVLKYYSELINFEGVNKKTSVVAKVFNNIESGIDTVSIKDTITFKLRFPRYLISNPTEEINYRCEGNFVFATVGIPSYPERKADLGYDFYWWIIKSTYITTGTENKPTDSSIFDSGVTISSGDILIYEVATKTYTRQHTAPLYDWRLELTEKTFEVTRDIGVTKAIVTVKDVENTTIKNAEGSEIALDNCITEIEEISNYDLLTPIQTEYPRIHQDLLEISLNTVNFSIETVFTDTDVLGSEYIYSINATLDRKIKNKEDSNYTTIDSSFEIDGLPIDLKHDCIADFEDYLYCDYNSETISFDYGAKGRDLELKLVKATAANIEEKESLRLLKEGEIYRFGIEFLNTFGIKSFSHWICDLKIPYGVNLDGANPLDYYSIEIIIKNQNKLIEQGITGYNILRVERTQSDKTILGQAIVSTMMAQGEYTNADFSGMNNNEVITGGDYENYSNGYKYREDATIALPKVVNPLLHTFTQPSTFQYLTLHLRDMSENSDYWNYNNTYKNPYIFTASNRSRELCFSHRGTYPAKKSVSYTKMWQLYCPEIEFSDYSMDFDSIQGITIQSQSNIFKKGVSAQEIFTDKSKINIASKIGSYFIGDNIFQNHDNALIASSGNDNSMDKYTFSNYFSNPEYVKKYKSVKIYGNPLKLTIGESSKYYNNDARYTVINSLESITGDGVTSELTSIYSDGNKSVVVIPKVDDSDLVGTDESAPINHLALENYYTCVKNITFIPYTNKEDIIVVDLIKTLTNQYGGDTYESRSLNKYITIGEYNKVDNTVTTIKNPGDIYVQDYTFLRVGTNDQDVVVPGYIGINEIITYKCETSINLKARNDLLNSYTTNSIPLPTFTTCANYNSVYNRESNYFSVPSKPFYFKESTYFPNDIISTKLKIAGETIDSFTQWLVNERISCNGKYGKIVKLSEFTDFLYAIQEEAISYISINPRVQTQGNDGIQIQLGTGQVLDKILYLSTVSGVKYEDRRGIFKSPTGVYFYDRNNASFNKMNRDGIKSISSEKGMNSYFVSIPAESEILGVYDFIKDDALLTIGNKTLYFNEVFNNFVTFCSMASKGWDSTDKNILSFYQKDGKASIWLNNSNQYYNNFYGVQYPSKIEIFINPEQGLYDCRFDNLEWRSSLKLDVGLDSSRYMWGSTFDKLIVSDSFQTTGEITIKPKNKFGIWRVPFPRVNIAKPTGNRLRSPWVKLTLILDTYSDKKFNLYDIIVSYVPIIMK